MPTNIKLKRYDGSGWNTYHPETHIDQVKGDDNVHLKDELDARFEKVNIGGNSSDDLKYSKVAPIGGNDKIPLDFIPGGALGGMRMVGSITDQDDFDSFVDNKDSEHETTVGNYVIVSSDTDGGVELSLSGDDYFKTGTGAIQQSITVTPGDWIVESGYLKEILTTTCEWEQDGDPYTSDEDETTHNSCSDGATKIECFPNVDGTEYSCTKYVGVESGEDADYYLWAVINNNQSHLYLAKNGDTMNGNLDMDENNVVNVTEFGFQNSLKLTSSDGILKFDSDEVWTAGNDGSGSGLNADKLDGEHGSYYTDADNLDSGTIPDGRFPSTIPADISGNASTADKWRSSMSFTFADSSDVKKSNDGNIVFDGSSDVELDLKVEDNSHNHGMSTIEISEQGLNTDFFDLGSDSDLADFIDKAADKIQETVRTFVGGSSDEPSDSREGDLWLETV